MNVFKPTEVLMMMSSFASMETVHVAAYSHLLDTIGMPETEYTAFMKYKEMKDKYDYMQGFDVKSNHDIAKTIAVFSAFHRRSSVVRKFCNFVKLFQDTTR
jgi:Ribonucleotide reductase, beta subunit